MCPKSPKMMSLNFPKKVPRFSGMALELPFRPALRDGVRSGGATALSCTKIEPLDCLRRPGKKVVGSHVVNGSTLGVTGSTPRGREFDVCYVLSLPCVAQAASHGPLLGIAIPTHSPRHTNYAYDGSTAAKDAFSCSLSSCSYTPPSREVGVPREMGSGGGSSIK